jgi:transposase
MPRFTERCRQLSEARSENPWLARVRLRIARLKTYETDRRKDWVEKTSTNVARRFDVIRVEDLDIVSMTRSAKGTVEQPGRNVRAKAGLNRSIRRSGWGCCFAAWRT